MADNQAINFGFSRIITEEFAITEELYDPAKEAEVKLNLIFSFLDAQYAVVVRIKCLVYQDHRLLLVITVACFFAIHTVPGHSGFDKTTRTFRLHRNAALHLASLTAATTRGVLHAKTENLPINAAVLPAIDLNEIVKEDVILTP